MFGSSVSLVMTVPADRSHFMDTSLIHTPHYCRQFDTVAAACKVSSHRSQRKTTQHSLSLFPLFYGLIGQQTILLVFRVRRAST